jgi:hypothetical protein
MRRIILLSSILLLSAVWMVAQSENDSSESGTSTDYPLSSRATVVGCLDGAIGNYTLTNAAGATYQLTGNTEPLKAHVGETMRVTGILTPVVHTPGAMSEGTRTEPTLSVIGFQRVSQVCGDNNNIP